MVLKSHKQYSIYVSFFSSSFSLIIIVTKIAIQLDTFVPKLSVYKSLMMAEEVRIEIEICKIGMVL